MKVQITLLLLVNKFIIHFLLKFTFPDKNLNLIKIEIKI